MDLKEQMKQITAEEYAAHPGLERFQKTKKNLMLLMMLFILINKILALSVMVSSSILAMAVGLIMGMCIPGIFALAVYRGPWKFAFALFLLGAPPAFELAKFIVQIPQLSAGGASILSSPVVLLAFITETAYTIIILGTALWLTVPARSRELGEAAHRLGAKLNEFVKANQPQQGRL